MNEIHKKEQWRRVLADQRVYFTEVRRRPTVEREMLAELLKLMASPHPVVISGLRRAGKSTLLAQLANALNKGIRGDDSFYYINFEDERFTHFKSEDFNSLLELLLELYGEKKLFLIDEIQNIDEWERFVRRLADQGTKFVITGSNARLLSRELGSKLTGRHLSLELLPFSFREYLEFKKYPIHDPHKLTTVQSAGLRRQLNSYIEEGGIAEALKFPELPILQTLYQDILYRDIVARHNISEVAALRELAATLLANSATHIVYDKLKKQIGLGSINTIKSFIGYFQDSWLFLIVNLFAASVKKQQINPKKVYVIDTGLIRKAGFAASSNRGHLLENLVFLELRRKWQDIYYYRTAQEYEVDFYIPKEHLFIQVTQTLESNDTRERELRALGDALKSHPKCHGMIICEDESHVIKESGLKIPVVSLSHWLISLRNADKSFLLTML